MYQSIQSLFCSSENNFANEHENIYLHSKTFLHILENVVKPIEEIVLSNLKKARYFFSDM